MGTAHTTRRALFAAAPAIGLAVAGVTATAAGATEAQHAFVGYIANLHRNGRSCAEYALTLGLDPDDLVLIELAHKWEPVGSMPKLTFSRNGEKTTVGPDGHHVWREGVTYARWVD